VTGKPRRGQPRTVTRPSILIFAEGKRTEPVYLTHWYRRYRDRVLIKIDDFHGTPMTLVQRAAEQRRLDLREERRGRGTAFSEYWCMFDVDEHPHLPEALELAAREHISVAVTNPCIELWFLLHFRDQYAAVERGQVQRWARELLGCEKVLSPSALDKLAAGYEDAKRRAQSLDCKHERDCSPPGSNPSSSAWRLIDSIRP
jgi:RloB-like protein